MLKPDSVRPSIETLITLFAALIGFGLINLLRNPFDGLWYLPFLVSLTLFLRFLTGSRNHLWHEHGDPGNHEVKSSKFQWDLANLLVFGIIAVFMCYSNSIAEYAFWGVALLLGALAWNLLAQVNSWAYWKMLNFIHLLIMVTFFVAVYGWEWLGFSPISIGGAEIPQIWAWVALLVANIIILIFDFNGQLSKLSTMNTKSKKIDWLLSILRVAGASFPVASSLVQLQAEIDSKALLERITKLEDPISNLHTDVPELSRLIYRKLKISNTTNLEFDTMFYTKFSRALAALESKRYLKNLHTIGKGYQAGINLVDPSFIMYLCSLEEDSEKMESLLKIVDNCKVGQWLDGKSIEIDLPLPVIKAVFDIYESKGYGLCSKEVGTCKYKAKA